MPDATLIVGASGEIVFANVHAEAVFGRYAVAAVRDITGRLPVEDQLRRVLWTLDASDDAVFMFDASTLRFTFVDDGAVRMSGYTTEELLAMSPLHLGPNAIDTEYRSLTLDRVADP